MSTTDYVMDIFDFIVDYMINKYDVEVFYYALNGFLLILDTKKPFTKEEQRKLKCVMYRICQLLLESKYYDNLNVRKSSDKSELFEAIKTYKNEDYPPNAMISVLHNKLIEFL